MRLLLLMLACKACVLLLICVCAASPEACPSNLERAGDPARETAETPCGVQPWHTAYRDSDPRLHVQANGEAREIIDISLPLHAGTPMWDSDEGQGQELRQVVQRMDDGDPCNESRLKCSVHTGTHVDAPGHFVNEAFKEGRGVESLNLYVLNGPAHVVEVMSDGNITAHNLQQAKIPEGVRRLLLKTKNTEWGLWSKTPFQPGYVGLMPEAAKWLLDNTAVKLVGFDYLSAGPFGEPDQTMTHQALLGKGVILLEGLVLDKVSPGLYNMHCLPLKLVGSEGSPTRCILMK